MQINSPLTKSVHLGILDSLPFACTTGMGLPQPSCLSLLALLLVFSDFGRVFDLSLTVCHLVVVQRHWTASMTSSPKLALLQM